MPKSLVCALAVLVALVPHVQAQTHAVHSTGPWPIAAIEVTGNQRYSLAHVTRISGLTLQQRVTITQLDETIAQMATTGLFAEIGYRYALSDVVAGALTITFEITEPEWVVPVVFDNFVSFPDEELIAAIEADVPTFDGTVPTAEGVIQRVQRSLESHLKSKGITAPVGMERYLEARTRDFVYLFRMEHGNLGICGATVTGASEAMAGPAAAAVDALRSMEYSRVRVDATARNVLRAVYEDAGHLGAEVGVPVSTLSGLCEGVSVTVSVDAGEPYYWGPVEWRGVTLANTADLDRALALSSDTPARSPALTIKTRRMPVLQQLRRVGLLNSTINHTHTVDHAARLVRVTIQVNEGPQFRMGSLDIVNLPSEDQEALLMRWALRKGDVFDQTYLLRFMRDHATPVARRLMIRNLQPVTTIPPGTAVVNIRIDFRR